MSSDAYAGLAAQYGVKCSAGEVLFREGDAGAHMYILQQGRVRLFKQVAGAERTLTNVLSGDFFGELSILNRKPRTATAVAVEDCDLLKINADLFETMVLKNTEIGLRLIRKLAQRLDAADALITMLMHEDPRAKVILSLCREAETHGTPQEDGSLLVEWTEEHLSAQSGVEPAKLHPILLRLSGLGIVRRSGTGWLIPRLERLKDFLFFLEAPTP